VLTLAVFGLAALLSQDGDTGGEPRSETTSEPSDQGGNDDSNDSGGEDPNGDPQPPPMPPIGGDPQDGLVELDESKFLDEPARFALETLTDMDLRPTVVDENGERPTDLGSCIVTDVSPNGDVPVGSAVSVRCEQGEDPPR
jgi:hypothetical protein